MYAHKTIQKLIIYLKKKENQLFFLLSNDLRIRISKSKKKMICEKELFYI